MKQGDIGTELIFTISDDKGNILDLSQVDYAEIVIKAKKHFVTSECEILEPKDEGKLKYTIQDGDLDVHGDYEIEILIVFLDGDAFTTSRVYEYVEDKLKEVR